MLVISRRAGERIVIGNDVHVIVTDIRRRSVRIGVVGKPETTILRGEVYEAIERANRAAAETTFASEAALEVALTGRPRKALDSAKPLVSTSSLCPAKEGAREPE